jgi:hypothetical protein
LFVSTDIFVNFRLHEVVFRTEFISRNPTARKRVLISQQRSGFQESTTSIFSHPRALLLNRQRRFLFNNRISAATSFPIRFVGPLTCHNIILSPVVSFPGDFFLSGFTTKTYYASVMSSLRVTCPALLILRWFTSQRRDMKGR